MNNLFLETEETNDERKVNQQFQKIQVIQPREIQVTHYILNNNIIAVTVNGDTTPLKRFFIGETVYETKYPHHEEYQCPLQFKYTSTEGGHIQTLHSQAMKHGRKKKITNYEDEFPGPWRTNGRAYINGVVGSKEIQGNKKGKLKYNNDKCFLNLINFMSQIMKELQRRFGANLVAIAFYLLVENMRKVRRSIALASMRMNNT